MTKQRTFKRRVRERMEKTGESYTAARRVLIAEGHRPDPPPADEPPVSDAKIREATGRGWDEWIAILHEWGAAERTHTEIARWICDEHGVAAWYAQSVTVGWERANGRAPGQHADGFEVSVSKTVPVAVERLYDAFADPASRVRWLPGAELGERTTTPHRSARYDWEDGSTRLIVSFESLADEKSRVVVAHTRLPDADAADGMKAWWRQRLDALPAALIDG